MAECILDENTVAISPDTIYEGDLYGFGDSDSFSFTMSENETVTFLIKLINDADASSLPRGTLTLFRLDGNNDDIQLGTSHLWVQNNIFTYDGIVGDYYFCLENFYESTYQLEVGFTDYDGVIFPIATALTGEYADGDWPPIEIPKCHEEMGYKIIDGNLPLDIGNLPNEFNFHSAGIITGTPGEQDCESENYEAPSWNWKEYDQSVGMNPTAKEYNFKVRAYFIDHPFVYLDRWFKVCVHNNWDYDEPDILNLQRAEYDVSYIDREIDGQSELCPPCIETKTIITERIIDFQKWDIDGFLEQLNKMMYEKQCAERHKLPKQDPIYHESKKIEEVAEVLCQVCPKDK